MYLETRGARWSLLLCAIGLMSIFLFGCDLSSPASEEPGEEPDGTTLPNGLTITPIPDGGRLTAPGSKQGNASEASPYGCMLSTPNLGGDATYRYDAVYLHFPASIVNNAEGLRHITFGALSHTAYSDEIRDQPIIMRLAQCRVPDSDAAEAMAREYLRRFPAPSDDVQWTGATVGNPNKSLFPPDSRKGYQCLNYEIESIICVGPFNGNPEVCTVEVTCTQWVYIDDDDNDGGGSGSGSGDDPVACNPDGGPTDQICIEGGGAVPDDPVFIENPCDRPDPPAYCSQAGSCYDANIANDEHEAILKVIEDQGALNQLWTDSNFDAPQEQRLEQGGWIVQDPTTGTVSFQPFPDNWASAPCEIIPITPPGGPTIPDNAVGIIHTHPFETGEQMEACFSEPVATIGDQELYPTYDNEPSPEDIKTISGLKNAGYDVTGYVIDKDNIVVYDETTDLGPQSSNPPVQYDRCGY